MKYCFLRYPEGKFKAVAFTYDDGTRHDLRFAETIDRYGIKCTFNLCSGMLGQSTTDSRLTPEEIQEHILDKGHEIAVHGEYHIAPVLSRPIKAIQDILNCRLQLEQTFGIMVRGMGYADVALKNFQNGASYENIREYLKDLGIVYARCSGFDPNGFQLPTDWHHWAYTSRHNNPKVKEYIQNFMALDPDKMYCASRYPRLFMLAGHSFEFHNDNNWELLEELCTLLGGHEDIWYATSIEIYEYVNAYNALVFSADSTKVYNPTLHKIWFDVDGTLHTIDPGQTVTI